MQREQFLKDIGKRLKELRGNRSQENISNELSKILGEERTKEAYQHYEAGRRLLPADVLWGVSQIFGVSTDWILTGKDIESEKKPGILKSLSEDTIYIAELIQSLPKEEKEAVKTIIKSIGANAKSAKGH